MEPRTVVVFGDSITAGCELPEDQRDRAWISVAEAGSRGRMRLLNEGRGGRATSSLDEFAAMLARHPRFDALALALGMNDSRDISGTCVAAAAANIRGMIDLARGRDAALPIAVIGPTNIRIDALGPSRPIGARRADNLRRLDSAFAALADDLRCAFIGLQGVVPEASLAHDGVHPDAAGHAAIAAVLLPALMIVADQRRP